MELWRLRAQQEFKRNDLQDIQAVAHRLKFMRLTLQSLNALKPVKSISPNEQEMNEIVRLLNGAIDLSPLIKKTIALGIQPVENGNCKSGTFECH